MRSECHWRNDQKRGLEWNHLRGRLYIHLAHSRREDGRVDLVEELEAYFRLQFHFCCGLFPFSMLLLLWRSGKKESANLLLGKCSETFALASTNDSRIV